MDSNQLGEHLGSEAKRFAYIYVSKTLPDPPPPPPPPPPPASPVNFFLSQMACADVPPIVLHVLCSTRTFRGHFRPSEVRFRGILVLSGILFYWEAQLKKTPCIIFKLDFLKTLSSRNFELLDF